MHADTINAAVVLAIKDSAVPKIDEQKLLDVFGVADGQWLVARVSTLVQEAVDMPIDWDNMTLEQGVAHILRCFHGKHPDLSPEALHEIGRCVGWNLR